MTWRGILDYICALNDPGPLPSLEEWSKWSFWKKF